MILGLAFLDDEHGALAAAESLPLLRHQRIGDVEDVERHAARAEGIGAAEQLERPQRVVVQPALQNDADVGRLAPEQLVHAALGDEALRGGQALLDLLLLLRVGRRRQDDAPVVALRVRQRLRGANAGRRLSSAVKRP